MLRRDSDATSLATGESVSRVNSHHDPKTIQMDLMMGREAAWGCRSLFRPLGSVSWIKFLFPRHGRCWAKPIQSGHAVQRKRCGSLNRSFSYWEGARSLRPPLPTLGKRLLEPRRPLVGAFRRSSGVCPSPAGFSFFREIALQKWSGCLAGHWGERFQAKFWD